MGMSRSVKFNGRPPPAWERVRSCLAEHGLPVQMRMVDGELAAPDEMPPEDWHELRVGTSLGMVAVRRGPDWVEVVTWSSADMLMLHAWNAIAWAYSEVGQGLITIDEGEITAGEFIKRVEMPDCWQ